MSNRISLQQVIGLILAENKERYHDIETWPVLKFTNGKEYWTITFERPNSIMELKGRMSRARELLDATSAAGGTR